MKLTYGYQVNPGHCHVCGNSHATLNGVPQKVIDTDRDDPSTVKRYHIYLCGDCVTAAYQMLDSTKEFIDKQALADLRGENVALTNEISRLMADAEAMDTRIAKAIVTSGAVTEGASA